MDIKDVVLSEEHLTHSLEKAMKVALANIDNIYECYRDDEETEKIDSEKLMHSLKAIELIKRIKAYK